MYTCERKVTFGLHEAVLLGGRSPDDECLMPSGGGRMVKMKKEVIVKEKGADECDEDSNDKEREGRVK